MALINHTAAGQALGYYFQIERAIYWLANSPAESVIGIETEDDIVVQLALGEKIHEQDKSSTTVYPFTVSKADLWKTILIWLEAAKEGEIDLKHTTLFLVTNKVSENSFVEILGNAEKESELEECLTIIKKYSDKYSGVVKSKIDEVLSYDSGLIKNLIKKIKYSSGLNVCGPGFREQLISDLQIVEDDSEVKDSIIKTLFGYVFTQVVDAWRKKEPAYVERDAFMRVKNKEVSKIKERVINQKIFYEIGQIDADVVRTEYNSQYINQLSLIDGDQTVMQDAICDYINSVRTKTLIAKKGYITRPQIKLMEDDLCQRWKSISGIQKIVHSDKSDVQIGQLIYLETMEHNAKIGDVETSGYFLTRGSYHSLAEDLTLGWHPKYTLLLVPVTNG